MATSIDTLLGDIDDPREEDKIKVKERLTVVDKAWLKNSYLINPQDMDSETRGAMYWSSAHLKFTDTSLGGNFGIN